MLNRQISIKGENKSIFIDIFNYGHTVTWFTHTVYGLLKVTEMNAWFFLKF